MSSINNLNPELLAELVSEIDGLGIEVNYLRAAKESIRRAVTERNVPLEVICAVVNRRLKQFDRTVEPGHIQTLLESSETGFGVPENIFQVSFRGGAPPTAGPCSLPPITP